MVSQDCKTAFRLRDKTSSDGTINILGCFESQSPPSQAFVCNSTFISARNTCKIQNVNPMCADSYNPKDNSSLKVFGCYTFAINPTVEDFRCKNRSGEELACFIDPTLATVELNSTNSGEISLSPPRREGSAADPTCTDPKNSQIVPEAREDAFTGSRNGPIWAAVITLGVLLCISLIAIALLLLKLRRRSPKTFADVQTADKVMNSKSDDIVAAKLSRRRTVPAKPFLESFLETKMPLYSYNFGHAIIANTQTPILRLSTDYDDSMALMLHSWFFSEVRSFVEDCLRSSIRNSVFQFLSGQEAVHPQSDKLALISHISNFVFTNFFASLSSSDRIITFHALLRSVSSESGAILLPTQVADKEAVDSIFKALLQQFLSPANVSTPIDPKVHPELLEHQTMIESSIF
ncbi:hypothetical protein BKA69DRAFT_1101604 [Paraphysoderma sedebokerense]|nr:hypothetical protein BKA69DRAFT_1101604 [Paraphysoderma sedebokerense]